MKGPVSRVARGEAKEQLSDLILPRTQSPVNMTL